MDNLVFRPLQARDYPDYARLQQNAYASAYKGTKEERDKIVEKLETLCDKRDVTLWGGFVDNRMVACMSTYLFDMNFHGTMIKAAGVGSVATDLVYKKHGIAKRLVFFCLDWATDKGADVFALYPFRPSFYRDFGFGFGSPVHHFKLPPDCFIDHGDRSLLLSSDKSAIPDIVTFFNAEATKRHGMMKKSSVDLYRLESAENLRYLLAKDKDELIGYMIFSAFGTKDDHMMKQALFVHELLWSDRRAYAAFSSFFSTQRDQFDYIMLHAFEPGLYQGLQNFEYEPDPKILPLINHKAGELGLGLMWQALNPSALLSYLHTEGFPAVRLTITWPRSARKETLTLGGPGHQVADIQMDLSSFSSWIMGCVRLQELYDMCALDTDNPEALHKIDQRLSLATPQCYNRY